MAIPAVIQLQGALLGAQAPGGPASALMEIMNVSCQGTFQFSKSARPTIIGATPLAPFVIPFEGVTKVRFFAARARGGSLVLRLTSVQGADQLIPLGSEGLFLNFNPAPGDEFTAIALSGTGDLEYVLAGDLA